MEVDSATPLTATEANRGHDGDVPTNEETQRSFAAMEESSPINNDDPAAAGESTTSSQTTEDPQRKESADKASSGKTANKRIDWASEVEECDRERDNEELDTTVESDASINRNDTGFGAFVGRRVLTIAPADLVATGPSDQQIVTQSSDSEFHCLTITVFYRGKDS